MKTAPIVAVRQLNGSTQPFARLRSLKCEAVHADGMSERNIATTASSLLYGKHGRLGVGRTKFFEDYVHRNDGGVEQFIAGTSVRRLKLVKIGQRAVAAISDEVDQLIEALRAERDAP